MCALAEYSYVCMEFDVITMKCENCNGLPKLHPRCSMHAYALPIEVNVLVNVHKNEQRKA